MLPELGHLCVIIAGTMCVLTCVVAPTRLSSVNIMRPIALSQTFFISLAFTLLAMAFLQNDFSVVYVAQNSNSSLPWYYKLTAIWGAHEGSLLLWILELSIWSLALVLVSRKWPLTFSNYVLLIFAMVNLAFIMILLFSSNPFLRQLDLIPIDGRDLNPLLQDLGMIVHPPVLYMGYVGCTVPFSLTLAAALNRSMNLEWAQIMRPWVLSIWLFLTLGIALGSFWAYYELGWGGWWFWDPVENASLMPWLTTTALLHTLSVSRKNGHLLNLASFLAILTFGLSLFGTFLVRSGSIISVHSFAKDPQRGALLLCLLVAVIAISIAIILWKRRHWAKPASDAPIARQGFLIANVISLLVITGTVLLGTLYPLIHEAMFSETLSVGYPYFNAVVVPIVMVLLSCMLYAFLGAARKLLLTSIVALCIAAVTLYLMFGYIQYIALLGATFAIAVAISSWSKNIVMFLAHLGFCITMLGISVTTQYEIEKDILLRVGENYHIANFDIAFANINPVEGPNYVGFAGEFSIHRDHKLLTSIFPEKRTYLASSNAMSETAIYAGLLQDVYIALGQSISPDTWSVRIYYKPLVRAIWLGAVVMGLGALCGIVKRTNTRPNFKQIAF